MTYFHVSLAQPSHSSAGQSRTLMSHSVVFVWQATWCILNKVPFTRGKKSIIVHLQRAPTACRQLSHLLSVWAGPFPTMKRLFKIKIVLYSNGVEPCSSQRTERTDISHHQSNETRVDVGTVPVRFASFTCPWNGLNASRNAHHPKEMFLVNTKDSFEALELNSGIWTCLSRTCAQNSTATSGTLSWA